MLEVPGWLDSHKLAKAVAVVIALKKTARVSLDFSNILGASGLRIGEDIVSQ